MRGRKLLAAAAALALPAVSASAKLGSTESFLKEIDDKILNLAGDVVNIAGYIIGLAAALLLIMIFIESNKPQSQSKDALVRWFGCDWSVQDNDDLSFASDLGRRL